MPDHIKKVFSLATAFILTLIIISVWWSVDGGTVVKEDKIENKLSALSPLQVLKDEFGKALTKFEEQTASLKELTAVPTDITSGELGTSTDLVASSSPGLIISTSTLDDSSTSTAKNSDQSVSTTTN